MNHQDDNEPLSRQAYREATQRANRRQRRFAGADHSSGNDGLIHRQDQEDQETANPEGREASPIESREAEFSASQALSAEEKTARLKHRLNVAIVVLLALIVVVYLILFFVD